MAQCAPRAGTARQVRRRLVSLARTAALGPLGVAEQWLRRDPLLPPLDLRWEYYRSPSPATFRKACDDARLELMSRGLVPEHRVLDIGCGVGNLAVALAGWLAGDYHGFDVNPRAVAWCQRAVSARWPHFHFHHVDLQSGAYHRQGKNDGAQFVFPLADAGVDVAFAGSLFTHLLPPVARQYLHECGRVLAPGGTCVASFFLLNDETRAGIHRGASFMSFDHAVDGGRCLIHDPEVPEAATALDEAWVVDQFTEAGLRVVDIRRGGWWSGRSHDQDVVTAVRGNGPGA